jgi:PAS domain S-box-containing protein
VTGLIPLVVCVISSAFAADAPSTGIHSGGKTLNVLQASQDTLHWISGGASLILVILVVTGYALKQKLKKKMEELKASQEELLTKNEILRLAAKGAHAGIWDFYPETNTGFLSEEWYIMLGYTPKAQKIPLTEWRYFIHPDDLRSADAAFADFLTSGSKGQFETEFRLKKADGTYNWFLATGRAVTWNPDGNPSRIIGLNIEIQNLKEAHEKLAASEAKFKAIFDHAPYSIVINSFPEGNYIDANRHFLKTWDISKEQLPGMRSQDFGFTSDEETEKIFKELLDKGSLINKETAVYKKDGKRSDIIYSSTLIDVQGKTQILSITVDVTERKRAEEALKESEARFRSLFKFAPLPLASSDHDGRILDVNDRLVQILGYTIHDIPDLDHWWRAAYPDPGYRKGVMDQWETDLAHSREYGTDITPREYRITCMDGTVRTMIVCTTVIGERLIVSFFDISDRKKAEEEKEKLQEQLLQSQKLEAVGVLAGGVAHDFNNMLGAIIGYAELTLGDIGPESPIRPNLGRILDAAQRSASLTRQLLAFARKQTVAPMVLELNQAVEEILKLLQRLIGENIDLAWIPSKNPCIVKMDPTQIDQILTNLCVNARDAIRDVGKITIETENVTFDDDYCRTHSEFKPGNYVLLAVSDDGCGITRETLEHIFEPFFTTKGPGQGTGLGLATVYGIIKQNDGFINIYSEPEKGTTFRIYFRQHDADIKTIRRSRSETLPKCNGETILIVEDDPTLLTMGVQMLTRLGFNVIKASNPFEAIRIVQDSRDAIHLFITDVIMPDMNGRDLAVRLQSIQPGIKHLFMSGYTANVIVHQGVLDQGVNFIQKPFSMKELGIKIHGILNPEASRV